MNFAKPLVSRDVKNPTEADVEDNIRELARGSAAFRQADGGDGETTANNLSALLGRVSGTSAREIDNLIGELCSLREKLQADGYRLQHDIAQYASLSQQIMQVTRIISDSVKKLPDAPSGR
jgi:hypothetical protein